MTGARDRKDCSGCCACAAACPHKAITMRPDSMGFLYPDVDMSLCEECGICDKTCAHKPVSGNGEQRSYAIRFPALVDGSQSGGLAYALMSKAVSAGYIVYGASMDESFKVRHTRAENIGDIEGMRLSKYVQSSMEGVPEMVLKDLRDGRKVLFTGTPCQCAGVASLCARYRDRLLLADILCHGVPAPRVWEDFLDMSRKQKGKEMKRVLFRDPALGWRSEHTLLEFDGGETIHTDRYYFIFLKNLVNRPSCGTCPFAGTARPSDVTMGDCWGLEKVAPDFVKDRSGYSLMLVNTPAGADFAADFPFEPEIMPVELESVMQESLSAPAARSPHSDEAEAIFAREGLPGIDARFGVDSPRERAKRLLHRLNPTNTKLYRRIAK